MTTTREPQPLNPILRSAGYSLLWCGVLLGCGARTTDAREGSDDPQGHVQQRDAGVDGGANEVNGARESSNASDETSREGAEHGPATDVLPANSAPVVDTGDLGESEGAPAPVSSGQHVDPLASSFAEETEPELIEAIDPCPGSAKRVRRLDLEPEEPAQELIQPLDACGNGQTVLPEACDDGNVSSGDGCSADCLEVEPQYTCADGALCVFVPVCGDGRLSDGEACDDGNRLSGDGCSPACALERDWACVEPGSECVYLVVCGDGVVAAGEQCEPEVAGAGCNEMCQPVPGWSCPSGAECAPICGDGTVLGAEQCDDGNLERGDGCTERCRLETDVVCDESGCAATVCGDGAVEGSEACDVGGAPDMGCSQDCEFEPQCDTAPGSCIDLCGDGWISGDEACDDGNITTGDGCANCLVELGFVCDALTFAAPSELLLQVDPKPTTSDCYNICGDGVVAGDELCDLGPESSTACSADCSARCGDGHFDEGEACDNGVNADGYYLGVSSCAPGCVLPPYCGDGVVDGSFGEECDLTNEFNQAYYGGCNNRCELAPHCGDGVHQECDEECDDGNFDNGDGCNVVCNLEPIIRTR